jgi:hypothetical protein
MEAPAEILLWIGSVVTAVVVPKAVDRFLSRGEKAEAAQREAAAKAEQARRETDMRADAEFKAEVRSDLKRLLDGQQVSSTSIELLKQTVASHQQRMDGLETRQSKQAEHHLDAIEGLRRELSGAPRQPRGRGK